MKAPTIYLLNHGPHDKVPWNVQHELLSGGPRLIIESYTPQTSGSGVFHESYKPGSRMSPYVRYVEESTRDEVFGGLEAGYSRLLHKLIMKGKRDLELVTGYTEIECIKQRDFDGLAQAEAEKAVFIADQVKADPLAEIVCGDYVLAGLRAIIEDSGNLEHAKQEIYARVLGRTTCMPSSKQRFSRCTL